jgi:Leucine-rich repeat (LRR) protein
MKKISTLVFLLFTCSFTTIVVNAQVDETDSLALVDLYNSTDGPHWTNHSGWLTGPVKNWYGITVDNNRVAWIELNNNNLSGKIPSSLGNLSSLNNLYIPGNRLTGTIPPELSNLSNLRQLVLYDNRLSGSIPPELGNLSNLQLVFLYNNQLSGTIPHELGMLSNLQNLDFRSNRLSGSIPPEIGKLPNLTTLNIGYNELSGSIPPELGNCYALKYLYLDNNQLSGSIPSELANITSIYVLYLNNNQLSGSIPPKLVNLSQIWYLLLDHNNLSGTIPSFGNLFFLSILSISYNQFTFDGMEEVVKRFPFAGYDHQARINVNANGNTLSVPSGGTLSNNTYVWVKKGQKDTIRIFGDSTFHPTESGTYLVRVKNKIAKDLKLTSNIIHYTAPLTVDAITSKKTGISNEQFSVYPNPAKDVLHITTNGSASFSLINSSGKMLFTTDINKTGSINVSTVAAGEYYLKNNITSVTSKVVIIK